MNSDRHKLAQFFLEEGLDKAKCLVDDYEPTELVQAVAEEVWNSTNKAQEWMLKPHPMLEGKSPLCASSTKQGALKAIAILGRAYYGSAA